jgi:hypothetical protein
MKGPGTKQNIATYITNELKSFKVLIDELNDFMGWLQVELIYTSMPENAKSAYSFLGTMKSKASQILSGPVNTYTKEHPKQNSKYLEGIKDIIMNFRDGKITTIGKANTAVSKLLKFINGTLFELVAANAIVMSNAHGEKNIYYTVVEALDKAKLR